MSSVLCAIPDCSRPRYARGWCRRCYKRWWRHGDPEHRERIRGDDEARFWSYVEKGDDCWEWTGARNRGYGYGKLRVADRFVLAHRYAYELLVGPIPEGLDLDHLCRNIICVNPGHLEPVTVAENNRRASLSASAHRSLIPS
jgi:hypothetical protein